MKTLQELYEEIIQSEELKKQFSEAAKNGTVIEFAKANGVETTIEDIKAFFEEKKNNEGEISDNEAENVSGGGCGEDAIGNIASVASFGLGCVSTGYW